MGAGGLLGLFAGCQTESTELPTEPILTSGSDRSGYTWKQIRNEFNIDSDLDYLNNATMGLSPVSVIDAVKAQIDLVNSTGNYSSAEPGLKLSMSSLLGVTQHELAFTHNVTEGINIAAWSLDLKSGDEVILTDQEHVGNAVPWLNRRRKDGIEIKMLTLPDTAEECLAKLKLLVTSKTKVIAVPHVTCTTGQVLPIKEICAFARQNGIKTFIDGAHGVGMLSLNLKDMGCDLYASCGHKWLLGPKGTGILYVRQEVIKELDSQFVGGHSDTGWTISEDESDMLGLKDDGHRYYYGTQNSSLFSGMTEAVSFIQSIGQKKIESRILELNQFLYSKLVKIPEIKLLTPEERQSRCGILSFVLNSGDIKSLYGAMKKEKWKLRFVPESNLDCIRVSTHIYNSEEQLERLVHRLKNI